VVYTGSMGLGGLILAFTISWSFSLMTLAYMPIIMFGFAVFGGKLKKA
jgi:hypothetical protein